MAGDTPDAAQWVILGALLALGGSVIFLHRGQRHIIRHTERLEDKMGVVATTLKTIDDQLKKAHGEITGQIEELLSRDTLDAEDRAALEAVAATAQKLDDVVADAVTEPLPDPEEAPATDGGEPVVDPANPVVETTPEVETPVADNAPTVGDGEVIDNADGDALSGEDGASVDGTVPADDAVVDETPAEQAPATGDSGAAEDDTNA